MLKNLIFVFMFTIIISCEKTELNSDDKGSEYYENQIKNVVWSECKYNDDCQSIGYKPKSCGGYHEWLVYSKSSTDIDLLTELVGKYNEQLKKKDVASDCSYVVQPKLVCQNQKCIAQENN